MMAREVAWRVFAGEYNASDLEHSEEGERSPTYVVTPLGAKVNRLFAVGVITDIENIGTDGEPLWRARLQDPTGVFYISAGQYQPQAAAVLSKLNVPAFAAVVGKSRTYSPEDGVVYVSIRPEAVKEVSADERDLWVLDACKSLKIRIEAMGEALKMDPVKADELQALGYDQKLSQGLVMSVEHYGQVDLDWYKSMLLDSLRFLLPEFKTDDVAMEMDKDEQVLEAEPKDEAEADENEDTILEIVKTLDKDINVASWDDILQKAEKKGLKRIAVDEAVNNLLDKGLIYEPVLGWLKVT